MSKQLTVLYYISLYMFDHSGVHILTTRLLCGKIILICYGIIIVMMMITTIIKLWLLTIIVVM